MTRIADQIGKAIRAACKTKGWSLSKLAREADVATPTILDYAAGKRLPRIDTLEKIVRALGSDEMLGAILGEIGPASKSKRARA